MPKVDRPTNDYFLWLGQTESNKAPAPEASDHLVHNLYPAWAVRPDADPVDTLDQDQPHGLTWDELVDTGEGKDAKDEEEAGKGKGRVRQTLLDTLVANADPDHAESPLGIIYDNKVRLERNRSHEIKDEDAQSRTTLGRVRAVQKRMAVRDGKAENPRFQHSEVEGFDARVYPLPGTSFAWAGLRPSVGRHETVHAKIEADRMFDAGRDRRHGTAIADITAAPLSARAAREMVAGERYKVTTTKASYVESGIKYTPTLLFPPLVCSSPVHDLGASGKLEFQTGVEGETTVEVMRGFGSKVAVMISARDDRVDPGKDRSFRLGLGAFVDGSWAEYVTHAFKKLALRNIDSELKSLEDERRKMDQKLLPYFQKFNDNAASFIEGRKKEMDKRVTLYEVVFDLSKPDARKTFNKLVGAGWRGGKPIDFTAVQKLGDTKGIDVVSNNLRKASHKGIGMTLGAFGIGYGKEWVTENANSREEVGDKIRTITEKNRGVVTRRRVFGRAVSSTTVGRGKTIKHEETGETHTEIGFGWRYKLDAKHASASEIGDLLSFATEAGDDEDARGKLERLGDVAAELPRRRLLGIATGDGGLGEASTELSVDLDGGAVKRLLGQLDGGEQERELWQSLAAAYARQHDLAQPPTWPVPELDKPGALGWLRRAVRFNATDSAFIAARNAIELLKKAAAEMDPMKAAKHLSRAFDQLNDELALAGALVARARGDENTGVRTSFAIEGAEPLSGAYVEPADDGAADAEHDDQPIGSEAPMPMPVLA